MNSIPQIQPNNTTQPVTMSSVELVEFINNHRKEVATAEKPYVELRHDSFMVKVPKVLGENQSPKFIGSYQDGRGRTYPCYRFPKRESCLLAMSYSYELQALVFDRMTAMEEALKQSVALLPDFTDPAAAARAWAEQFEAKQLAQQQIAELAPKAEALDTIADTTNTYCLRDCAKTIGIRESDLIKLLIDKKWIYRDADRKLQPHAQYVLNKVFTNRTSPVIVNRIDGKERVFLHMRVTAFGLTRITGLVNKNRKVAA
ncbi:MULTISPECIES: phage antirepressor KilAC domain-containing protein [unclassified Acinetobacter]|uniref:phage antirepressor KilAC domain-containing protein n=1 Tax=unclassified Acinetobacter TaxID=196816 RepID=UPI0007D07F5A|nr:phage antirepressor KilAC domain-containing protein [Acinetobacter sp. SFA]